MYRVIKKIFIGVSVLILLVWVYGTIDDATNNPFRLIGTRIQFEIYPNEIFEIERTCSFGGGCGLSSNIQRFESGKNINFNAFLYLDKYTEFKKEGETVWFIIPINVSRQEHSPTSVTMDRHLYIALFSKTNDKKSIFHSAIKLPSDLKFKLVDNIYVEQNDNIIVFWTESKINTYTRDLKTIIHRDGSILKELETDILITTPDAQHDRNEAEEIKTVNHESSTVSSNLKQQDEIGTSLDTQKNIEDPILFTDKNNVYTFEYPAKWRLERRQNYIQIYNYPEPTDDNSRFGIGENKIEGGQILNIADIAEFNSFQKIVIANRKVYRKDGGIDGYWNWTQILIPLLGKDELVSFIFYGDMNNFDSISTILLDGFKFNTI